MGRHDRRDARRRPGDFAGREVPGFFVATGFSGHGFGIGPGGGAARRRSGRREPPVVDPMTFRLSRFSDGSNPAGSQHLRICEQLPSRGGTQLRKHEGRGP